MRLQKLGHSCVRLTKDHDVDTGVLVIDPGGLTEPEAMDGAAAVLVTHEHFDHLDEKRLTAALESNGQLQIWSIPSIVDRLTPEGRHRDRVHAVAAGDAFTAGGFEVRAYGETHAVIHPRIPQVANVGFLVDGDVFHPGDAFTVPDRQVRSLLAPTHAPWMKVSEVLDYILELRPARAYSIHDGLLNDNGLGLVDNHLGLAAKWTGADCRRLAPGESVRTE